MEQGMSRRPKALVIGGGIAGPVTAIFLKKAGIDAELFEAWPYSTGIGGGLQIAPNGMHVLAEIGLADEMIRRGSIAESFDFIRNQAHGLGSVNQNMRQRFGQPAVNMCRATLNEALINKAWCENVELRFEKRLVAIEDRADKPVVAHFADGSFAEGDFVIGADGVHSAVRAHVVPDGLKAVRHRPDRLRRLRAAIVDRGHGRSASAWRRRSDKAAFSVTASAVPIPTTA
jgi:2-polyprenyl-6-methoxyphenol hydroxylase-like FAD-dependent oxidoreductase